MVVLRMEQYALMLIEVITEVIECREFLYFVIYSQELFGVIDEDYITSICTWCTTSTHESFVT